MWGDIIFIFGCRVAHLLEMERKEMEILKRVWIDLSLFISNIIKMNVQRATCI
jgi:hypothetical protein